MFLNKKLSTSMSILDEVYSKKMWQQWVDY